MEHDIRSLGEYWVREDMESYKVKKIVINPSGRLK